MKNTKRIILSLVIALLLVIIVQVIWDSFIKADKTIYLAVREIYKGEKISSEDIKEFKVKYSSTLVNSYDIDISSKIASKNISRGKILDMHDICDELKEGDNEEKYEYVTIEVEGIDKSLAYQLNVDDYINVYYTVKNNNLELAVGEKESLKVLDNTNTVRLFEKVKVISLYDLEGREIEGEGKYNAIMIRVNKEEAMMIEAFKEDGSFSVSKVR